MRMLKFHSGCAVLAAIACLSVAACSDTAPTVASGQPLTTDSASYVANPIGNGQVEVRVVTTFRNASSQPVSLDRCSDASHSPVYGVVAASDSTDASAYDPAWGCVAVPPLIVAPGATRVDTLKLTGQTAFTSDGQPVGTLDGSFRLVYGGHESNAFQITLPPGGPIPPVQRDLTADVQTDSLIVHLRHDDDFYGARSPLKVSIYNPRSDTSYIVNCDGIVPVILEKQVAGQWVNGWGGAYPACLSAAIVIPPHAHYDASLMIEGGARGTKTEPQFAQDYVPGIYRIVVESMVDSFTFTPPKWGNALPVELGQSNPFVIVVDP